ncbi:hypothetical protein AMES_1159 [Amycolatopsis mediterranei S699]|uniref:Secreted protein n=2 Tax=Amycolatopsis mediterranei TaxID=33910 RepID=A0A0H3D0D1_AMYMU|nr:hypothetical protein [Amycolatopsis mediterranei]ADJ42981.1 hypothetical protein AMED_1166 [Amycolatopsis mediterranei U32]AFO74695.1 hypothetical protein AMES_1159 [Amycolatopsis mediterranei S699]AGT81824.1 hypothetical protein B737_1160 [Amycolatopsis mediterranei RB]UZF68124.1 hypothetical protein ISP_001175 [Amycolatopsis mediterranei]
MRYKHMAAGVVAASLLTLVVTGTAEAKDRRCGPTYEQDGFGSLGTSFTLKSKHDDDGPGGSFVVGEEFEIHTNVSGQVWTITFADNGKVFFTGDDVSTTTGIREQHPTANQPGVTQHMTADALNHTTGETIHGFLDVLPVPRCGG